MNRFLTECLRALQIVAPATFTYSWHSLRHMAASSQSAIGAICARKLTATMTNDDLALFPLFHTGSWQVMHIVRSIGCVRYSTWH